MQSVQSADKKSSAKTLKSQVSVGSHSLQYQVLSKRLNDQNRSALPGDAVLYDIKPPRVDYYDVFYFETRVRDMMDEYMVPFK